MFHSDKEDHQTGKRDQDASPHSDGDCACANSNSSNYANADIAAVYKQYNDENQRSNPFRKRHASAHNRICRFQKLKAAKVVDLAAYRAILNYFVARR